MGEIAGPGSDMMLQILFQVMNPFSTDHFSSADVKLPKQKDRYRYHQDDYDGYSVIFGLIGSLILGLIIWGLIFWALLG